MQRSSRLSQPSSLLFCYCFSLHHICKPANIRWQKSRHVFACVCINLHVSGHRPAKACAFLLWRDVITSPELSDNCIGELVLCVKTKWSIKYLFLELASNKTVKLWPACGMWYTRENVKSFLPSRNVYEITEVLLQQVKKIHELFSRVDSLFIALSLISSACCWMLNTEQCHSDL